jgi:hypothetical protein
MSGQLGPPRALLLLNRRFLSLFNILANELNHAWELFD